MALYLPPYPVYPLLTGARVLLREPQPTDVPQLFPLFAMRRQPMETVEEAHAALQELARQYTVAGSLVFTIVHKQTGQPAGYAGFYRGFADGAEVGYSLMPEYRGQGLVTEAVQLLCDFAFQTMRIPFVKANTDGTNTPSHNVLQRCRFYCTNPGEDNLWWRLEAPQPGSPDRPMDGV